MITILIMSKKYKFLYLTALYRDSRYSRFAEVEAEEKTKIE